MKQLTRLFLTAFVALGATALASAKEVKVTADDTMRFNVTEITASVSEPLTVNLENVGKLPKAAMGHNFVILKPGTDLATFANSAISAAGNEYIPTAEEQAAKVVGHTRMLGPGESDSVTVTFDEPGVYPFICSFPGHWALMKGTITVK